MAISSSTASPPAIRTYAHHSQPRGQNHQCRQVGYLPSKSEGAFLVYGLQGSLVLLTNLFLLTNNSCIISKFFSKFNC